VTEEKLDIARFYDEFIPNQEKAAFNERHLFLLRLLLAFGLRDGVRVLELGCGIGVTTELIANQNPHGRIVGVDLSPASIDAARRRVRWSGRVEFFASDVVTFEGAAGEEFDYVTLFDVIEHIPVTQHGALFGRVAARVSTGGYLVVNVPSHGYLTYLHAHEPEDLQIVDQPLLLTEILSVSEPAGLELIFFSTYGLWVRGDYSVLVFRRRVPFEKVSIPPLSRFARAAQALVRGGARRAPGHPLLWWLGAR
jgi:SAM-dependent methyltransferase